MSGGGGVSKRERGAGPWMCEPQPCRVQRLPWEVEERVANGGRQQARAGGHAPKIDRVANDWVALRGQVDADLMGAPRIEPAFQQTPRRPRDDGACGSGSARPCRPARQWPFVCGPSDLARWNPRSCRSPDWAGPRRERDRRGRGRGPRTPATNRPGQVRISRPPSHPMCPCPSDARCPGVVPRRCPARWPRNAPARRSQACRPRSPAPDGPLGRRAYRARSGHRPRTGSGSRSLAAAATPA